MTTHAALPGFESDSDLSPSTGSPEGARRALRRAVTLLSRRALTTSELRKRLEKDFAAEDIQRALETLQSSGYLNDGVVAASYVSNVRARERSTTLLRRELAQRGVDPETIDASLEEHDDLDAAVAAATRRWRALRRLEPEVARRRLRDYLARRGFARAAVESALHAVSVEDSEGALTSS